MTTYITLDVSLNSTSLTLPLRFFKGTIDWGDGSYPDTYSTNTSNPSHNYSLLSSYTIALQNVTNLTRYGYQAITNANYKSAITGFSYNNQITNLTSFETAFYGCTKLMSFNVSNNMSNVTTMREMFSGATSFNQPVTIDCSSCTTLYQLFYGATSFNSDLTFTNTSKVETMREMFRSATSFNQPVTIDCSSCTTLYQMFYGATSFNSSLILTNTSKVETMYEMFFGATSFNQPVTIDCSSCTTLYQMFYGATSFNNSLTLTNTSKVTTMYEMFFGATSFNQAVTIDCSSCTTLSGLFYNATSFNSSLTLTNTSNVDLMNAMFYGATNFNQPISLDCSSNLSFINFLNGASSFNNTLNLTPIPSLTSATNMLVNTSLSIENYSALIELWGSQTSLNSGVTLTATGIKYNQAAETEHDYLTSTKGWTIDDGGSIAPTIASIDPSNCPIKNSATTVTITGTNLSYTTSVIFGENAATDLNVISDTEITCTAPYNDTAQDVDVEVTTTYGTATTTFEYFIEPPSISSISPQKGPIYATTVVTITGANLNYNTVVKFGSYSATITSYADDKLICNSPYITEAGNVTVTVTTDYGEATTSFTYYAIPDTEPQYTTGSYNSTSSLGSGARTFASMVISGSHGKKASQNRIYNYANRRGQGNEYKNYLIDAMGIKYQPKVNPWSYI